MRFNAPNKINIMIQRDKEFFGRTDTKGNMLLCMAELKDFLKKFPNKRLILNLVVLEDDNYPAMIGFYYKYVIPILTKGFYAKGNRYTEKFVDELIREHSPITNKTKFNGKEYVNEALRFEQLPIHEAVEHLDFCKEYGAINLHVYIEDSINVYK